MSSIEEKIYPHIYPNQWSSIVTKQQLSFHTLSLGPLCLTSCICCIIKQEYLFSVLYPEFCLLRLCCGSCWKRASTPPTLSTLEPRQEYIFLPKINIIPPPSPNDFFLVLENLTLQLQHVSEIFLEKKMYLIQKKI